MVQTLALPFLEAAEPQSRTVLPLTKEQFGAWLPQQSPARRAWVAAAGFSAEAGSFCPLPGKAGAVDLILAGVEASDDLWSFAALPGKLPEGSYVIGEELDARCAYRAAIGWALGAYVFDRYKPRERQAARLVWPAACDRNAVIRAAEAVWFLRDLVNTPANDLGPQELADAAAMLAETFGASFRTIVGDDLLSENWPAVHAVGRASNRAPRLIDLRWGDEGPRVTIVGKGVCFDSGGLDLKPSKGMLLMKKDMGGAAHALALARMIMAAGCRVRLRVLVPAVENAVSGDAFRPLDVLATRKGLTVEVGNTDAEGRLILCDALTEACSESPELLIDFATLTGAARVALGPDLPAMFCNDEATAEALIRHAAAESDPLWRLPLHAPYRQMLNSRVADLGNVSDGPFAGAITAALFLERFVDATVPWVHLDIYAWNASDRPGRPKGGEAMGLRAAFALIDELARHRSATSQS